MVFSKYFYYILKDDARAQLVWLLLRLEFSVPAFMAFLWCFVMVHIPASAKRCHSSPPTWDTVYWCRPCLASVKLREDWCTGALRDSSSDVASGYVAYCRSRDTD